MQQFINGDDAQFEWLRSQIQEATMIFNDVSLPDTCTPDRCRIGFEYTEANGFKLYIDKSILFTGEHPNFAEWLANGETSFDTYDDMIEFIKELGTLFENSQQLQSDPSPPQDDLLKSHNVPSQSQSNFLQPQNDSSQPQSDPLSLTYSVTSPLGNHMTFSFKYEKVGTIWQAFIVECPDYGPRSTSNHATQRITHTDGRHYISLPPGLQKLDQITEISKMWAEATAKYIDVGGVFGR